MAERPSSREEIANWIKDSIDNWLRPHEALEILDRAFGRTETSKSLLLERLKSGKALAAAESSTWEGKTSGPSRTGPTPIPDDQWHYYQSSIGFWESGDLKFNLGYYQFSLNTVSVWYHGIRFFPGSIDDLAKTAPPRRKSPWIKPKPPTPEPEPEEPIAEKGPPVSEEHLRLWYDLYRRAYQGAADTEATAIKSATGMFPGKSVSRDRIRALRGAQKPGRKPRETAK
jgi:hypothetical protein